MATTYEGERGRRAWRDDLDFEPGNMPPLFGDTAAALIVDDNVQVRAMLERLLGREGYDCTSASGAAEARDRLAAKDYALALVDVMMPGESGLELVADMLAQHRDLAVVMVTGVDDPNLASLALDSGAYGYVVKPFQPNQLLITVTNAGRRRCLEIASRVYAQRLERTVDEQAADLDDALTCLNQTNAVNTTEDPEAAEAQARLAAIVESSHDAIIGKTKEGIVSSWNSGAERLYGYTEAEMVGCSFEILVPEEHRDDEMEILARIVRGERLERYRANRVRKDGTQMRVSLTMSPIVGADGTLIGVASVSSDLSERDRVEAMFHGVLDAAPDAILCADVDGCIVLVNAQVEQLFGYARAELLGQSIELLVPDQSRAIHAQRRREYIAHRRPRPMGVGMELSGRRKDGSEFPVEISLSTLETERGLLVSAAVRDVTERIEARAEHERLKARAEHERVENQVNQLQRLESLGQLAGGVAHDFNNLLAVILNYLSFVDEEITAAAETEDRWVRVSADIREVQRAAARAVQLTHQLLAFGRREVVKPSVVALNAVVAGVEQLLRRTLGEHVELVSELAPDLWNIVADAGQLEQVLVNLAVNGRDAMSDGGTLTIDTENVDVDENYALVHPGLMRGPHVRLRVSDTGTGMESEVLKRAFEPFFTTKPKGEGTGLGLATIYGIVTQTGGRAQLYSEPGLGTTFTALLPATAEARATADARVERPRGGGETILVVEDEDALREVTRRILARNGHDVLVAASGEEALAIATQHDGPIHLLLTDVVMPRMLGKEVAEGVAEMRPDTRILFMSGYAVPVLASKGTLAQGVALIEKPFTEAALLAKIRQELDG